MRVLFADIDDTISTRGKLTAEAYAAMERLSVAGIKVVPVTGRPAGWCDHIARFWPVAAIVGENGAFYFHHGGGRLERRFIQSLEERATARRKLDKLSKSVLKKFPGSALASDQDYRLCDLAIDFCEDVPPLEDFVAQEIRSHCEAAGANARVSSIHVNAWFGDYNKLSTALLCVRELWNLDATHDLESFAFCGDSPNDEPMFAHFPLSFGVANVARFLDQMKSRPAIVTKESHGAGFAEIADAILRARAQFISKA